MLLVERKFWNCMDDECELGKQMKRASKSRKADAVGRNPHSIVGRLVVLQSEDLKDPMTEVPETASIDGTFDTMDRVEQFIRADTNEWFTPDGMHEGRNGEQTAPIYICQVLRVVKAVPIVNLSVAIEEAQTPNPSRQDQAARKEL